MGFPVRSNIFRSGTNEQAYFARFPIQVAVLFSPEDQDFSNAFRDIFLDLDRLTDDYVAFFAVLDPPQNWVEAASSREWWRNYRSSVGQIGFSVDDRVLVREIARLFDVPWHALPSIVVSTNLWAAEFVTSATSPYHIGRQLETLTNLAREWGQPNIGHIADTLNHTFGFETEYYPPNDELRYRFNRVYSILDTAANPNRFDIEQYQRILDTELRLVESNLSRIRPRRRDSRQDLNDQDVVESLSSAAVDDIIEDVAGRLVAPATVALQIFQNLRSDINTDISRFLEEESLVMVETSLTVGNFLEGLENNSLGRLTPLRLGTQSTRGGRWSPSVDFTPGAQGAWKAFELEVNLSVIQAARAARTVRMPDFFARYDNNLPTLQSKVQTGIVNGRRIFKDINQEDWEDRRNGRHRLLPLGDAWYVFRAMKGVATEGFDSVIDVHLGQPLPSRLLDAWREIHQLRNKASHVQALRRDEYSRVLSSALSPDILNPLISLKRALSRR